MVDFLAGPLRGNRCVWHMCNYSIITACLSNIVTGIGIVGFPKIKIKRKSKKNFQILLSLCLSTGRQHRRKEGPPSCQDAALFGCLYKLRIRELGRKGRLFRKWRTFWKGRLPLPVVLPASSVPGCKMVDGSLSQPQGRSHSSLTLINCARGVNVRSEITISCFYIFV